MKLHRVFSVDVSTEAEQLWIFMSEIGRHLPAWECNSPLLSCMHVAPRIRPLPPVCVACYVLRATYYVLSRRNTSLEKKELDLIL